MNGLYQGSPGELLSSGASCAGFAHNSHTERTPDDHRDIVEVADGGDSPCGAGGGKEITGAKSAAFVAAPAESSAILGSLPRRVWALAELLQKCFGAYDDRNARTGATSWENTLDATAPQCAGTGTPRPRSAYCCSPQGPRPLQRT